MASLIGYQYGVVYQKHVWHRCIGTAFGTPFGCTYRNKLSMKGSVNVLMAQLMEMFVRITFGILFGVNYRKAYMITYLYTLLRDCTYGELLSEMHIGNKYGDIHSASQGDYFAAAYCV